MENKAHHYLKEWGINYIKNRDLLFRKIEFVEENKGGFDFYIKFRDKEQFFVVKPVIVNVNEVLSKFDPERHFGLVVLNTIGNFDALIKNWESFVRFKHLCIYFVNPFSELDKKWIIYPYTHNSICEKNSLEKGLKAMFEMVEPLTEQQIIDMFK